MATKKLLREANPLLEVSQALKRLQMKRDYFKREICNTIEGGYKEIYR
jgi:hypothetical protein